jgi:hypothetical protein
LPSNPICECGCGAIPPPRKYPSLTLRFVPGHQNRGRKPSPESNAKRAAKLRGRPRPEYLKRQWSEHHKAAGIRPSREAASRGARGKFREASASWKGGTTVVNGYRCRYRPDHPRRQPNGYVYEHMLVIEEKLGRPLQDGEVVHHIDGIKTNNTPDNLQIFSSQSEHASHHNDRRRRARAL